MMSVNSSEDESLVLSDTLAMIEKRQYVQQGWWKAGREDDCVSCQQNTKQNAYTRIP